ncbi:DUF4468 domain-containing protein [Chitinophaga niabensis]|uniref:DUF4468 domain-containing protein n=1 Tax=Chitinophaga niabensis TaxID=536979 RepID=UPI0031BB87BF
MKNTIIIFFLVMSTNCLSQSTTQYLLDVLPIIEGSVKYIGIEKLDSLNRNIIYDRGKRWVVDSYKSANDVIQLDDKENGEIVLKGYFKENWEATFMTIIAVDIYQTVKLQFKDGRYRYEIGNIRFKYRTSGTTIGTTYISGGSFDVSPEEFAKGRKKNAQKFFVKINNHLLSIINSITNHMKEDIKVKQDW